MTLNLVTLTWDLTDLVESGVSATLSIEPTAQLTDVTDGFVEVVVPRPVTFAGGTGQLAGIVANDNANVSPSGTGYTITVTTAAGQVIYDETVIIAYANGATQKLSSLTPAGPVTTMASYLEGTYPGGGAGAAEWLDGDGAWTAPTAAQTGADASGAAAAAQTAAESAATADVAAETSRAEGAEGTNASAIAAETSRAETAESGKAALAGAAFTGAVSSTSSISAGTFVQGARVIATGLSGATAASRYVGATAGGAPVSGTFNTGDFVVDQLGQMWVCTAGGSPGTWTVTSAAALAAAAAFATSAVATETGRAETAEGLAAQKASNLSDLASASTARTNLGLGTAAVAALSSLLQAANNLSDLASAATARTNLGVPAGTTPAASVNFKPGNPAGTTSTTLVMMGLGQAGGGQSLLYTPAGSGIVRIDLAAQIYVITGATGITIGGRYGTGSAPANAAAVTGTRWGGSADAAIRPSNFSAANGGQYSATDRLVLTPGTQYWFDLALDTGTAADEAFVANISCTIQELIA